MASLNDVRFLLIDDNSHMLTIVEALVRGFGAKKIILAQSGSEAGHLIRTDPPDVVICDYLLGGINVCDLARSVRVEQNPSIKLIPIILLTAYTSLARITLARDAGINTVCQKPVSAKDLFRRLVFVVDRPQFFVNVATYSGPDRRRANASRYLGVERRGVRSTLSDPTEQSFRGSVQAVDSSQLCYSVADGEAQGFDSVSINTC